MEKLGYLTIKLFVHTQPMDPYGRMTGNWRTLYKRMVERDKVNGILAGFMEMNPWLQTSDNLDVYFSTMEHIHSN